MSSAPPRPAELGAADFGTADVGVAFLDDLFDRAVRAYSDQTPIDADAALAMWPDLAPRITAVLRLARRITLVQPLALPAVAGYDLIEELGSGGMGVVWLARQRALGRLVALKMLPPGAVASARSRTRFLAEARALARVRHPALVQVFDVVADEAVCAYAMQLVEGRSLAQVLAGMRTRGRRDAAAFFAELGGDLGRDLGRDPPVQTPLHVGLCRSFANLLRALAALHRAGLVHRDVKPSNILVRPDGEAVLADLGLVLDAEGAGLTGTGQLVGTPAYAAPEQQRGERAAPAADVWAAGVALFEALTCVHPFAATAAAGVRARILADAPTALRAVDRGLPRDLETILSKAIAHAPAQRYASADAFADDLERLLALQPIAAVPASLATRARKALRRHRHVWSAAVVGMVVALLLGTLVLQHFAERAEWPARSRGAVRRAQLHLLLPTFAEQALIALRGISGEDTASLGFPAAQVGLALSAYEEAARWWPLEGAAALERDVVRVVRGLARAPAGLAHAAPLTASVTLGAAFPNAGDARLTAAAPADRRALGLLAYLSGEAGACLAAWSGLDLHEDGDALIDAAAGALYLLEERPGRALPRLLAARARFPEAGFLVVAAADAAARSGDLQLAERLLVAAAPLELQDPYETHLGVRMELLAARGRVDDAMAVLRDLRQRHRAGTARARMAGWLAGAGQFSAAVRLLDELRRDAPWADPQSTRLYATLDAWWQAMPPCAWVDDVLGARADVAVDAVPLPGIDRFAVGALLRSLRDRPLAEATGSVEAGGRGQPARGQPSVVGWSLLPLDTQAATPPRGSAAPQGRPDWRDLELTSELLAMTSPFSICWRVRPPAHRRVAHLAVALDSLFGRRGVLAAWPPALRAHWRATFGRVGLALGALGIGLFAAPASAQTPSWQRQTPTTSPSPRRLLPAAIDPATDRVVVYGGYTGTSMPSSEFWTWTGTTWQLLSAVPNPGPREGPTLVEDPSGGLLLFGGWDGANYVASTWRWAQGAWTELHVPGPSPREVARAAFDAARNVVVLYGGRVPDGSPSGRSIGDTWEWDGSQWLQRHPATSPPPLDHHTMIYHPIRQRVMIFGGHTFPGSVLHDQLWEWDGVNWVPVAVAGLRPGPRWTHGMSFDPGTGKVVVFGGGDYASPLDETWEYDGSAWTLVATQGAQPSPRSYVAQSYDPVTHATLVVGGYVGGANQETNETWLYGVSRAPVDAQRTTVDANVARVSAFAGQALVTVTPRSGAGELLGSRLAVTLTTDAGTLLGAVADHGDGTYSQVLQAAPGAAAATVRAAVDAVAIVDTATVTFVPVDVARSTVSVTPEATFVGGHCLVTVWPRDDQGVAVGSGLTVALQTTLGTLVGAVVDQQDGSYAQRLDATQLGTAAVTATVDGLALPPASLTVLDGSIGAVIGLRSDLTPLPYDTIQQAVNRAATDQVVRILVNPGTYDEIVQVRGRSHLRLEGLSSFGLVTVRGFRCVDSSDIEIAYFDIDGSQRARHGIKLLGGCNRNQGVSVHDCFIHDVRSPFDAIFVARDNCGVTLRDLRIERSGGDGISLADGACEATITAVTILDSGLDGIRTADQATVRIEHCRIENSGVRGDPKQGYGIFRQRHRTGFAALITLIENVLSGNRGRPVADKSSANLGNYDQMLDSSDRQSGF